MNPLKLAQLMCSRLCHDLITPVGAISTGLEIFSASPNDIDSELLNLTIHSSENAAQRLIYYRAAFGYSAANILSTPEKINTLLSAYLKTYKIILDWYCNVGESEHNHVQEYGRILVNIVGIMAECAPYGGVFMLTISPAVEGCGLHFSFSLKGDLVNFKSENRLALLGDLLDKEVTPHSVQSYLTYQFLDMKGSEISIVESSAEHLEICLETESLKGQHYGSLF